jgi:hypothetical protein
VPSGKYRVLSAATAADATKKRIMVTTDEASLKAEFGSRQMTQGDPL